MSEMKATHTPGPWVYQDGYIVAGSWPYGDNVCGIDHDLRRGTPDANGSLIAAAPDLLAALLSVLDEYRDGYGLRCVDQVRAAVTKATGA